MSFLLQRLFVVIVAYRAEILRWSAITVVLGSLFFAIDVPRWADEHGHFFTLNIGQGDALLLRSAEGKTMLVDGGPDEKVLEELGETLPFFKRDIDYVVLTHPDADHLNGLIGVLERYTVHHILLTGVQSDNATYQKLFSVVRARSIPLIFAVAPLQFTLDDFSVRLVWPTESFVGKTSLSLNDTSVVLRVDTSQTSVLLTGDLGENAEKMLVAQGEDVVDVDILKAGHHGSKNSSSSLFLEAVTPETVVISVGEDNHYGHPATAMMKRVGKIGAKVYRTDRDGRVELILD